MTRSMVRSCRAVGIVGAPLQVVFDNIGKPVPARPADRALPEAHGIRVFPKTEIESPMHGSVVAQSADGGVRYATTQAAQWA
jgi:hypothetical protein